MNRQGQTLYIITPETDLKLHFYCPSPGGGILYTNQKQRENPKYVIFLPPQIPFLAQQIICVTIEKNPEINSIEKYKELSISPMYEVNESLLTHKEDLNLIEEDGIIVWVSAWHVKDGWKLGSKNKIAQDAGGKEGIIVNSMYIVDGVTFSLTGYSTIAKADEFKKAFGYAGINFVPGVLPDIIAASNSEETGENPNNTVPTDNNGDISYENTGTREITPPVIHILEPVELADGRNLKVEYQGAEVYVAGIVDDESGVSQVFINGQEAQLVPVEEDKEDITEDMIKPLEFKSDVLLTLGENNIEIVAIDVMGNKKSETYTLNRGADAGEVGPIKGEQWAVVIGVSKFQHPDINPLSYTDDDAIAVYNYLTAEGGFAKENVQLLIDEDATTVNIKKALGEFLSKKSGKDDLVFIYFAGHGAPEADPGSGDNDGYSKYMITYDTDPESLYSTAMPMNEIATIFERIYAEKIVFFIDSCYSGASGGRTFSSSEGGRAMNISDGFLAELSGKGRLIITASDANEISLEKDELKHGIFTYYMLEGLKGEGDIDGDGYITVDELYGYLYDKVARVSEQKQHPTKKGESQGHIVIGVSKSSDGGEDQE